MAVRLAPCPLMRVILMLVLCRDPQAGAPLLDRANGQGPRERRACQGSAVRVGEDRQMVAVAERGCGQPVSRARALDTHTALALCTQ